MTPPVGSSMHEYKARPGMVSRSTSFARSKRRNGRDLMPVRSRTHMCDTSKMAAPPPARPLSRDHERLQYMGLSVSGPVAPSAVLGARTLSTQLLSRCVHDT